MNKACEKSKAVPVRSSCCDEPQANKRKVDYLLLISGGILLISYVLYLVAPAAVAESTALHHFTKSVVEIIHTMWWGALLGMLMVGVLSKVPREFVMSILGTRRDGGFRGILRATLAGVLLDLCNHGILMVGTKLYERGASIGQLMAFLLASPWNSFSLTLVLFAMVGWKWTLMFIVLSMIIAISVGLLFDALVRRGVVASNPNTSELDANFKFWQQASQRWQQAQFDRTFFKELTVSAIQDSKMVLRWLLFGVVLASAIRAFVPVEFYQNNFGPTMLGLMLTVLAATIIEVCSEGSTPIAADLVTRASAPGNGFAFLMAGVATDYTEIMVIKDMTRSWRTSLLLPLLTVPQVMVVALILNGM